MKNAMKLKKANLLGKNWQKIRFNLLIIVYFRNNKVASLLKISTSKTAGTNFLTDKLGDNQVCYAFRYLLYRSCLHTVWYWKL